MSKTMSIHKFSAFTSDITRNPWLLTNIQQEAVKAAGEGGTFTITEHGAVTTVTAVAA